MANYVALRGTVSVQKLGSVRITHQKAAQTCTPRIVVGIVAVRIIIGNRVCVAGKQLALATFAS
jgi:hypothetical protein